MSGYNYSDMIKDFGNQRANGDLRLGQEIERNIKLHLDTLQEYFGYKNSSRSALYAKDLTELNYSVNDIYHICENIRLTSSSFPSLSDLIAKLGQRHSKKEDALKKAKEELGIQLKKESDNNELYLSNFKKTFPDKDVNDYVQYWFSQIFSEVYKAKLKKFGVNLTLFTKSALIDLHEAHYDPQKAVAIGRKKLAQSACQKKSLSI